MEDERVVRIAKALGDATRFRLLQTVADAGEISVGELAEVVGVSQPTVSHHLRSLADCGLVAVRHAGQHSFFAVEGDAIEALCGSLRARFSHVSRLPDLGWGVID